MKNISELLGCKYPIIQGAMGVISNPEFVAAVSEAGGIGDRRGYQAAFVLGAVGVQSGTAFIAAEECIAHANYKNALISASESDTRLMNVEWAQFRIVATPVAEEMVAKGGPSKAEFSAQGASIEAAWVHGDLEAGTIPAGQSTGMIKAIRPAPEGGSSTRWPGRKARPTEKSPGDSIR